VSGHVRQARRVLGAIALAPFSRRAGAEASYCLLGLPLAVAGFVLVLVPLTLGALLALSLIGAVLGLLLVLVATGLARAFAGAHGRLAGRVLGDDLPEPSTARPGGGMLAGLDARLRDAAGWRSVAYVLVKLPAAALGAYALGWWVTALFDLAAPLRWALLSLQDPAPARGVPVITPLPFGSPHAVTFADTFWAAAIGAATLVGAPWFTRGAVAVDRWLRRALLGAGPLARRVRDLEETRAIAVDDAAALLRRLERDLHDGAQVRLVALAMSLDMVKEKISGGAAATDTADVRTLVETSHSQAVEALAELRSLARGLHPPSLDDGLANALATLTSASRLPVDLAVEVSRRPTPAIETIAYFCAAELLTNVIKHSGAGRASMTVTQAGGGPLRLRVTDDGCGGARLIGGGGLSGLSQRVRTVDGSLDVASPVGGPTAVNVTLPLHA